MSLLGTLGGIASGFLTGGPAGAVAGGILGAFGGKPSNPVGPPVPSGGPFGPYGVAGGVTIGGQNGITIGGRIAPTGYAPGGGGAAGAAGGAPRGYHLNKHPLPACKSHGAVPARTIYVRNRRMNPLNPRALRKALHREKAARKLMSKLHVFHRAAPARRRSRK
jgi:hypothetical protein